jgi:hypothetical protein
MLDADSTQLLFRDDSRNVYNRSGGADHLLARGVNPREYALHSTGAVFSDWDTQQGFEWSSGTLTSLGTVNTQLTATGRWVMWSNAADLFRRDVSTGTTVQVSSNALHYDNALTPEGDVVYASLDGGIYRYHDGASTPVTSSGYWPVVDGETVVFTRTDHNESSHPDGAYIVLARKGVEVVLSQRQIPLRPQLAYAARDGYVAFLSSDDGWFWGYSPFDCHVMDPSGFDHLVVRAPCALRALGPNGTLVYNKNGAMYALRAPYTGTPVRLAREWNSLAPGETGFKFRGDELILMIGRTAFRASY